MNIRISGASEQNVPYVHQQYRILYLQKSIHMRKRFYEIYIKEVYGSAHGCGAGCRAGGMRVCG